MMKLYKKPEVTIFGMEISDIVTLSVGTDYDNDGMDKDWVK